MNTAVRAHRKRQLEDRLELDGLWQDHGLVFTTQRGTLINPSNLRQRSFMPLLQKAGLPSTVRFHDLRHTCATLLLKERARPKEVQSLLGHKTIAMTMNNYGHFIPGMGKETADAMERALA
jgi:integrase